MTTPTDAPPLPNKFEEGADQLDRWSRGVIQPLLITTLVTVLATALLIAIGQIFDEPWPTLWPLYAVFFLETAYSTRWLRRPEQRLLGKGLFRAAEFVLFAVLFRLATWLLFGFTITEDPLRDYVYNPFLLFDTHFGGALFIAVCGWVLVVRLIVIFQILGIDAAEYAFFTTAPNEREQNARPVSLNRSLLVADLFRYWVVGGIVLTVIIGLTSLELNQLTRLGNLLTSRAAVPLPLLGLTLLYLVGGFLLLSQARLAAMSARWLMAGIGKKSAVERRWYGAGWRLLLLIALLAAFLPIGSTFPLLRLLNTIFQYLFLLVGTIFVVIQLFFSWLISLLPAPATTTAEQLPPADFSPPPLGQEMPPPPPPPDDSIPIFSIVMWVILIVVVVESILFFLHARGYKVPQSLFRRLWMELKQIWANWMEEWRYRRVLLDELTQFEAPDLDRLRPRRRWTLWRRPPRYDVLPPRERIRLFFIIILRLGGEQGVVRQPGETPREYARRLHEALAADAEPAVEGATGEDAAQLTQAFEQARYTVQELSEADAEAAEAVWKRLRTALKQMGKRAADGDKSVDNLA